MNLAFIYPLYQDDYLSFTSLEELTNKLKGQKQSRNLTMNNYSTHHCGKEKRFIYSRCRECKEGQLKFRLNLESGKYQLYFFINSHNHEQSSILKSTLRVQAKALIESLPSSFNRQQSKHYVCSILQLSSSTFYRIYDEYANPRISLEQILSDLDLKQHNHISYSPFPLSATEKPTILLSISPQMKELFKQFGHKISFDITYRLIHKEGDKHWRIGLIVGINNKSNIIPFGYCILADEKSQTIEALFTSFFQIMGHSKVSIVTDEQSSFISAFNQLKEKGFQHTHYHDLYHLMKNLDKWCKTDGLKSLIYKWFTTTSKQQAQLIKSSINQITSMQQQISFQRLSQKQQKVCYGLFQRYVGKCHSSSINQSANNLLKLLIKSQKKYETALLLLDRFCNSLIEKAKMSTLEIEKQPFEEYLGNYHIKQIRFMLSKSNFLCFRQQYTRSIICQIHSRRNNSAIVKQRNLIFNIVKRDNQSLYQCQCKQQARIGMPCAHILKLLSVDMETIIPYIHQFLLFQVNEQSKQFRRGKSSRKSVTW